MKESLNLQPCVRDLFCLFKTLNNSPLVFLKVVCNPPGMQDAVFLLLAISLKGKDL